MKKNLIPAKQARTKLLTHYLHSKSFEPAPSVNAGTVRDESSFPKDHVVTKLLNKIYTFTPSLNFIWRLRT